MKMKKIKHPHTLVLIYAMVVLTVIATRVAHLWSHHGCFGTRPVEMGKMGQMADPSAGYLGNICSSFPHSPCPDALGA